MRGKPLKKAIEGGENRITPAGAGKTQTAYDEMQYHKDHPRRCGENFLGFPSLLMPLGSPPQVRGKHSFKSSINAWIRITPAGAGKTPTANLNRCMQEDHPRRCGENVPRIAKEVAESGSPPQVRGKREEGIPVRVRQRITPAGAGKTNH